MTGGWAAPGFENVAEAFGRTLAGSAGGAAFAAFRGGDPLVDLWGGDRDPVAGEAWAEDTIALAFSGTKGIVSACVLLLVERGLLELDAPVARYWPAFAAGGKEAVLVRHVLSHTAGVPGLRSSFTTDDVPDYERMAAATAAEPPFWPPGERLAYHALTFGWICGELVRRTDGRSVGRFLADEVAEPLGLDLWIGLPVEEEPRVAALVPRSDYALTYLGDEPEPLFAAVYGSDFDVFRWNEEPLRRGEIPGGNAVVTARSLALLYASLGRLLSPETCALATRELSRGRCAVTRRPYAYGAGFELQTELARFGPVADAYGHTGTGGSVHGAWPSRGVAFSYLMTELRPETDDRRGIEILTALVAALG
jgi:CubicO group peptidase (beta-lactamase class C family)